MERELRELRELYNQKGESTGLTYYKGDKIPEGYYAMVVAMIIENSKGEILLQVRSKEKGGYLAVTGGHPKAGENAEQGLITEVYEELGIDISNDELIKFDEGCDGYDCFKFYHIKKDVDISKCKLQVDEVADVVWVPIDKLREMYDKNELQINQYCFFKRYFNYLNKRDTAN